MTYPTALTIAGSDSGGGAGIQADLKTFAFQQVHGTSAITCVTAQNTVGVQRVDPLAPEAVTAQIQSVVDDIGVQGVKTGMLLNAGIIQAVGRMIETYQLQSILVLDPVMVSRSGAQLLDDSAVEALKQLIPLAALVTPNRYEAQMLSGLDNIQTLDEMKSAAEIIVRNGAKSVLVKGGAMSGEARGADVWFDGEAFDILQAQPVETQNNHGTGCTLSAAIAAHIAFGKDLKTAVHIAKEYLTTALESALDLGAGSGPVGHFFPLQRHNQ
ncbi:phosphomethylpyrimidine kinase [Halothece sp. PCC 7418]|uniref:bifunctional hydroxymethylpyrimidine kinase/phosphomethylpyrimidine kinase n=1 Tax=Halothece sp. (strain PCC 7418) TaxID=65093 RepID=UPI0002A08BCB|nr:bifunctional hydroxymethylpyrimidine kinase/phosphomethylpyrimidine kinase [Halothece sp. PCC 7418]AFZ44121.1 phosphomethylpyrimidine kinase [Halothece sp. PCC 7418]